MARFVRLLICVVLFAFPAQAANYESAGYAATGTPGNALITNTPVQLGSVGFRSLTSVVANNPNGSTAYLQFFNGTAASVQLGTTVPQAVIPLGSAGPTIVSLPASAALNFPNGLAVAATTTAIGTAAPSTGITATIGYQ